MDVSKGIFNLIENKTAVFLVIGILVGAVSVYGFNTLAGEDGAEAQDLVETLEQRSGQDLELITSTRENGLQKIQVKDQQDTLQTYYMTPDGERVVEEQNLIDYSNFKKNVKASKEFSQCLNDRNFVMFGNQSQQTTLYQIQVLGGANMVSDFYADVGDNQTLQQALRLGIQRIPAFYYNQSVIEGVHTVPQLEEFTGCKYNASS